MDAGVFPDAHKVYYNPLGEEGTRQWVATFSTKYLAEDWLRHLAGSPFFTNYYEIVPV